jgi:hypothetical protein
MHVVQRGLAKSAWLSGPGWASVAFSQRNKQE